MEYVDMFLFIVILFFLSLVEIWIIKYISRSISVCFHLAAIEVVSFPILRINMVFKMVHISYLSVLQLSL